VRAADAWRWASPELTTIRILFVMIPLLPIYLAGRFLYWLLREHPKQMAEQMAEQEERDRLAREIAEETERRLISDILSGSDVPPFALYLRPFALDMNIRQNQGKISLLQPMRFINFFSEGLNFDYLLQNYYKSLGITLISIGSSNGFEGAGHLVTTDALWRERFRQLAERAKNIVVVPGIQPGIMAEIRWLRVSGLLVNSVFFKPIGYPKVEWQRIQELYEREEDIALPDYSPNQLSFRMYSSGRCYDVRMWGTVYLPGKKKRGAAQMKSLLSNKPLDNDRMNGSM
jgi:hypothetical protein